MYIHTYETISLSLSLSASPSLSLYLYIHIYMYDPSTRPKQVFGNQFEESLTRGVQEETHIREASGIWKVSERHLRGIWQASWMRLGDFWESWSNQEGGVIEQEP